MDKKLAAAIMALETNMEELTIAVKNNNNEEILWIAKCVVRDYARVQELKLKNNKSSES